MVAACLQKNQVRNFEDAEHADDTMRKVMLQRILALGRKYQAFIKPLIDAAESRIPGLAFGGSVCV